MINICDNVETSGLSVLLQEVHVDPHDDVVLECTLYDLVEKVR
jgi:hypothetical protein